MSNPGTRTRRLGAVARVIVIVFMIGAVLAILGSCVASLAS